MLTKKPLKTSNAFLAVILALIFSQTWGVINILADPIQPKTVILNEEQMVLKEGKVVILGEEGKYMAKVLIPAPIERVWQLLTDYDNFSKFLPNVTASKVLERKGNQTVYEQTNEVQVFVFRQTSRIAIATTETYPSQIKFRLKEGDIQSLEGTWTLTAIAPNQTLITNQVSVQPPAAVPSGLFFDIYKSTLADTLAALRQEAEKRASEPNLGPNLGSNPGRTLTK